MGGEQFNTPYLLVDGVYPNHRRLIKSIPNPGTEGEKQFTGFHVYARKDVERCFGMLKKRFSCLSVPFRLHYQLDI